VLAKNLFKGLKPPKWEYTLLPDNTYKQMRFKPWIS